MTRTTHRRPQTPLGQSRQTNHGHKRKGKPVETWMMELEKAQDEESGSQSLDFSAIEQIADGVERMVFSWGLDKQERGQEYTKVSKSLAKDSTQVILPWSMNKPDEILEFGCSADFITRGDPLDVFPKTTTKDVDPPIAGACSPSFSQLSPTIARSPQVEPQSLASQHEQEKIFQGSINDVHSSIFHEDFNQRHDVHDSHNVELGNNNALATDCHHHPRYDYCKGNIDSPLGELSSTYWLKNNILHDDETMHVFQSKERESTCQTIGVQQTNHDGSTQLELQEDIRPSNSCIWTNENNDGTKRDDNNVLLTKENALQPTFTMQVSHVRPIKAVSITPQGVNDMNWQEPPLPQIRNRSPSPLLTQELYGNESPLLSQSPLCAHSPMRNEPIQSSEALREGVGLSRRIDHLVGASCHELGSKRLSSSCLLPYEDANHGCTRDIESVEVGEYLFLFNYVLMNLTILYIRVIHIK